MWNEMMGSNVSATLETTSTDYRDRVDRMVAAIVCGWCARAGESGGWNDHIAAKYAIKQIDTIDAAIAQREKEKILKDTELVFKQKI